MLLDVDTSAGTFRLKFGEAYRVQHTPALRAELEQALAGDRGLARRYELVRQELAEMITSTRRSAHRQRALRRSCSLQLMTTH